MHFKKLYWTEFALIRCTNLSRKQMKTFVTYARIHFFNLFPTTKKWRLHDSAGWNENSYKWVYQVFSKAIWCQIFRKSITLHARLHFPILLRLCTLVNVSKLSRVYKKVVYAHVITEARWWNLISSSIWISYLKIMVTVHTVTGSRW